MDQLTKLIEQWCGDDQDSARGFIELFNYDKKQAKSWTRFVEFLASHPTCGEEQRKFLDGIEKMSEYIPPRKTYDGMETSASIIGSHDKDPHCYEFWQCDFTADLEKVIKGK